MHDALLSALAVYSTTLCNVPRDLKLEHLFPCTTDIFTEWNTKYLHTGCPGGNVPDFGRMFLKLKYADITKNTYIRS